MRILGIDSSLTGTGLARVDLLAWPPSRPARTDVEPVEFNAAVATVAAPKPTADKSKRAMVRRVNTLLEQIDAAFEDVDAVGLEGLAFGARGEGAWVLPWIWGRVLELCEKHDVPLTIVATSARAKFATGKGNAKKDAVTLAMDRLIPHAEITNDNEADALAVAAVVCQVHNVPILPVTQYRLDVLANLGD